MSEIKKHKHPEPIVRTTIGLIDALYDELDWLRNRKISTSRANATARIAEVIASIQRFNTP